MQFTDEQRRIFHFVENENGHGIIDAVAGAGKTTTIIECAKFVKDKNAILFCAFNISIAKEITNNFQKRGLGDVTVKTIHALGRQILLDNNNLGKPINLNDNKYREILKNVDLQDKLKPHVKKILKINGFEIDENDERQDFAVNDLIHRINNRLLEINQKFRATLTKEDIVEFEKMVIHFGIFNNIDIGKKGFREELEEYFECTKELLKAGNELSMNTMLIDYTDMLYLPYKWNQFPIKKFDFLFIDECQDLSISQFAITAKYGRKGGRILAVGDPKQSIYGFTGADIGSFDRVKDYTKAIQLPLTICFRCPKRVIDLAKMIREDIIGSKEENGIVDSILFEEILAFAKPGDLIISRLRAPLVILVFECIDKDIKVHIHEDDVREIISEIKNIFKQNELNAMIYTLPDEFNTLKISVTKRWNWIISKNSERIVDSLERSLFVANEELYLQKKLEFLHKKYEQWKNDCDTLTDILKKIKEFISTPHNSIKLSTIHRAKGLENDRVFILNYDELPYYRLNQKDWEMTQELNLKYVAVTRALKELYLIESKKVQSSEGESLFDDFPF